MIINNNTIITAKPKATLSSEVLLVVVAVDVDVDYVGRTIYYHYDTVESFPDSTYLNSVVVSNYIEGQGNSLDQISTSTDIIFDYFRGVTSDLDGALVEFEDQFTHVLQQQFVSFPTQGSQDYAYLANLCVDVFECVDGNVYKITVYLASNDLVWIEPTSYMKYMSYGLNLGGWAPATSGSFSTTSSPFGYEASGTSTINVVSNIVTNSTAFSRVLAYCNPFQFLSEFNLGNCLYYLIVPEPSDVQNYLDVIRNEAFGNIPFIGAFWTTSASELPEINVTIPSGIPGEGNNLTLSLDHSIDFLLNSTTTGFGTSTETFYEVTSFYWNTLLYILFGLYLLRRLYSKGLFDVQDPVNQDKKEYFRKRWIDSRKSRKK